MMLYKIVLCLLIVGGVTSVINESGFYSMHIPESGMTGMSEAQVTDLTNSAKSAPTNPFSMFIVLQTLVSVLISTFLVVITVIPLLTAYGVPFGFACMIQAIVWTVMAVGVYQMYTGHQMPGMD